MEPVGRLPLVTGAHSGTAKFWLGQLAELDERSWNVDVYRCATCGHVEMFDLNDYRAT